MGSNRHDIDDRCQCATIGDPSRIPSRPSPIRHRWPSPIITKLADPVPLRINFHYRTVGRISTLNAPLEVVSKHFQMVWKLIFLQTPFKNSSASTKLRGRNLKSLHPDKRVWPPAVCTKTKPSDQAQWVPLKLFEAVSGFEWHWASCGIIPEQAIADRCKRTHLYTTACSIAAIAFRMLTH